MELCPKVQVNMEPSFSRTRYHPTQQQQQHTMMATIISSVMQSITKYTTHLSKHFNDRNIIIQLDKLVKYFGRLCIREGQANFNFFARKGKEQVALAIVLTAIDLMKYKEIPKEHRQRIADDLYRIGSIDCGSGGGGADFDHQEVLRCRIQLRQIFKRRRQNFFRQANLKKKVLASNKPSDAPHDPRK
eukprot:394975_1